MKNQSPEKNQKTQMIMVTVLAVSIVLNLFFGIRSFGPGKVSDDYDKDNATDKTFYEEQVKLLETKNDALETKVKELELVVKKNPDKDDKKEEAGPVVEKEDNASDINNKRSAVYSTTSSFLDAFLNNDTAKETNEQKREKLAPYVTSELLAQAAPTDKDLADMGIVDEGHSEQDPKAPEKYSYVQKIESKNIYVDESSLNGSTINVLADIETTLKDNRGSDYEQTERYAIKAVEKDGKWVVSEYTIDKID